MTKSLFCWPCVLFKKTQAGRFSGRKLDGTWVGLQDVQNFGNYRNSHVISSAHSFSVVQLKFLGNEHIGKRIDMTNKLDNRPSPHFISSHFYTPLALSFISLFI